jgi:hypothetical protein
MGQTTSCLVVFCFSNEESRQDYGLCVYTSWQFMSVKEDLGLISTGIIGLYLLSRNTVVKILRIATLAVLDFSQYLM